MAVIAADKAKPSRSASRSATPRRRYSSSERTARACARVFLYEPAGIGAFRRISQISAMVSIRERPPSVRLAWPGTERAKPTDLFKCEKR